MDNGDERIQYLIDQYATFHAGSGYGPGDSLLRGPEAWSFGMLLDLLDENDCKTVIDYGCGKGVLVDLLNDYAEGEKYKAYGYDPAIPEYENVPKDVEFDALLCLDVLEHIPEEHMDEFFASLRDFDSKAYMLNICCKLAKQLLPDGTNPHVTVKNYGWWREKVEHFFSGDYNIDYVTNDTRVEILFQLIKKGE